MHGDYCYDLLKNTSDELQQQEAALRQALIDELRETSLLVTGYSGRDQSLMEALHGAYAVPGTGTLYWCGFSDSDIPSHVQTLIRHARAHGRQAYYVATLGFDDLLTRLALHCLRGEARKAANQGHGGVRARRQADARAMADAGMQGHHSEQEQFLRHRMPVGVAVLRLGAMAAGEGLVLPARTYRRSPDRSRPAQGQGARLRRCR